MRVRKWKSSNGTCSILMPNSCSSLRWAALFTPWTESGRFEPVSLETLSGCEQHVLVHMSGNVIFSDARCWRSKRFWSSNRKTEKARWRRPLSMLVMRWPVEQPPRDGISYHPHLARAGACLHIFLLALPMGMSFSSVTMHISSIRRICSSSWPSSASPLVSMSGKSRRMVSAVIGCEDVVVVETVVDAMMPGILFVDFPSKDEADWAAMGPVLGDRRKKIRSWLRSSGAGAPKEQGIAPLIWISGAGGVPSRSYMVSVPSSYSNMHSRQITATA